MAFLLCLTLLFNIVGCSSSSEPTSSSDSSKETSDQVKDTTEKEVVEEKQEEVLIKFPHYKTGNNVGAKFFLPQIDRFNDKYKGQYRIEVEEIVQDAYGDKIKLLYQSNKLPPMYQSPDRDFFEIIKDNHTYVDLKPYIDENPEFGSTLIEESVTYNTTETGEIVSLPYSYVRLIGAYYNKEIFTEAGIDTFPQTWEDFYTACDAIKEQTGKAPLALMTGENAWTLMLLTSSYMASMPEGKDMLKAQEMIVDYNTEFWNETFTFVQNMLQNYSTTSALGAGYSTAANDFFSESTAFIANGPWMIGDFSNPDKVGEGFKEKVGATIYPGGIGLGDASGSWYIISDTASEGEVEGLIEYFKFLYSPDELNAYLAAEGGFAPHVPMPEETLKQLDPVLAELNISLEKHMTDTVPTIFAVMPQPVQEEMTKNLPLLYSGDMTPVEFCEKLTLTAQKFNK